MSRTNNPVGATFYIPGNPAPNPPWRCGDEWQAYHGFAWYALTMRIRSLNHSRYQIEYHIIWGTRYRYKYLKDYVKLELRRYLYSATKKYPTLHISSFNTDQDHLHIQIEIPPNLSVAAVVRILKSESSKHLSKKFKFIREMYLDGSIWSVGYFVSTVGLNEEMIKRYIADQGRKDKGTTLRFGF